MLTFPLSGSAHCGILPAYSSPKPSKDQAEVAGGSTCCDRSLSASLLLSFPFPFHSLFSLFSPLLLSLSSSRPFYHTLLHPLHPLSSLVMGTGARTTAARMWWTVRAMILKLEAETLETGVTDGLLSREHYLLQAPEIPSLWILSSEGKPRAEDPSGTVPTKDTFFVSFSSLSQGLIFHLEESLLSFFKRISFKTIKLLSVIVLVLPRELIHLQLWNVSSPQSDWLRRNYVPRWMWTGWASSDWDSAQLAKAERQDIWVH